MQALARERLENAGIDVTGALERFMGNGVLLERFLKKFLSDPNYEKLAAAGGAGDQENALTAAHTLKGVCGNLGMTELFDLTAKQVAAFRAGRWEDAIRFMPNISLAYGRVIDGIRGLEQAAGNG